MNSRLIRALIVLRFGSQFSFAQKMGEHEAEVSRVLKGKRITAPKNRSNGQGR